MSDTIKRSNKTKTFRQTMLDPKNRRSKNIEDRRNDPPGTVAKAIGQDLVNTGRKAIKVANTNTSLSNKKRLALSKLGAKALVDGTILKNRGKRRIKQSGK